MGYVNRGGWRRLVVAVSLGSMLVGLGATTGCVVTMRARGSLVAESEPPPPQSEAVPGPRAGYVWVRGNWQWQNGQWVWKRGYWQRERAQYVWVDGHWERRGNKYHWVEGYWRAAGSATVTTSPPSGGVTVHDHRTQQPAPQPQPPAVVNVPSTPSRPAPPQPQAEPVPAGRAGYVWVRGYWYWDGSQYQWKKGYWERARAKMRWQDGYWERQGGDYVWVEGRWTAE